MRSRPVRIRSVMVVLMLGCFAALGASCGPAGDAEGDSRNRMQTDSDGSGSEAHTQPSGPMRTDLDPLIRRFPALGAPVTASWQSGVLGNKRVPGPSSYWIDAVVTLQPETARELRSTNSLAPTDSPKVTEDLRKALPPGPWLAGTQLDRIVSAGGSDAYRTQTFIAKDVDVIVLIAEGGPS